MKIRNTLLLIVVLSFLSCISTSTKPNTSAIYRVPAIYDKLPPNHVKPVQEMLEPLSGETQALLQRLYYLDSDVAFEVGKLPEFQGIVTKKSLLSLERFTDLVETACPKEKANLEELLNEGKVGFRKYCAPLQALFWFLEEDEENLLQFDDTVKVVVSLGWDFSDRNRWSDYGTVTDRLNSPALISFYEKAIFRYTSHSGQGHHVASAGRIFKLKSGCCSDYTAFSVNCLRKAGYKARAIRVQSPTGKPYHEVCEYEDKDGEVYIMDVDYWGNFDDDGIEKKEAYVKRLRQIGYSCH